MDTKKTTDEKEKSTIKGCCEGMTDEMMKNCRSNGISDCFSKMKKWKDKGSSDEKQNQNCWAGMMKSMQNNSYGCKTDPPPKNWRQS